MKVGDRVLVSQVSIDGDKWIKEGFAILIKQFETVEETGIPWCSLSNGSEKRKGPFERWFVRFEDDTFSEDFLRLIRPKDIWEK